MSASSPTPASLAAEVIQHLRPGRFVLLEGGAGTGKSTILREVARQQERSLVCASTGVAASLAGGWTVHRAFGINIDVPAGLCEIRSPSHLQLLAEASPVIIDEISMVRADLLDAVGARLREVSAPLSPFEKAAILAVGDPYQLPPVVKGEDKATLAGMGYGSPWFFAARALQKMEKLRICLTKNFRQAGDEAFFDLLNRIRKGDLQEGDLDRVNERIEVLEPTEGGRIPVVTTHKDTVRKINEDAFAEVKGLALGTIRATMEGSGLTEAEVEKAFVAPVKLELKQGARYMILRNGQDSEGREFYNGLLCQVLDYWVNDEGTPMVNVLPDGWIDPLTLSPWTWTIRVQGRAKKGESVEWKFTQIPLVLAYAITVHKCQGMTLDQAVIDFSQEAFSAGQVYVALSRLRSMNGLFLRARIRESDIMVATEAIDELEDWPTITLT